MRHFITDNLFPVQWHLWWYQLFETTVEKDIDILCRMAILTTCTTDQGFCPRVSIMFNEYTWIWIWNHMCISACKSARIYAHFFICIENILTKFYLYYHCIYCTLVHFMFACLQLFSYSFLFLFSLFFYCYYLSLSLQRFFRKNMNANFSPSLAIDWL